MTGEKDAPAEMPGDEDRLSAAWLGLNPYAPETWPLGTVQRLTRIRAERGHQKFVEEIAKMTTPPSASIGSIFNACCHREECRKLEARALAAEAALAAERERCAKIAESWDVDGDAPGNGHWEWATCETARDIAAAIRAQGE